METALTKLRIFLHGLLLAHFVAFGLRGSKLVLSCRATHVDVVGPCSVLDFVGFIGREGGQNEIRDRGWVGFFDDLQWDTTLQRWGCCWRHWRWLLTEAWYTAT